MDSTPVKRCSLCRVDFPATVEVFGINNASPDKIGYYCRSCKSLQAKRNRERRNQNGAVNARKRELRAADPEKHRAYDRAYRQRNAERVRALERARRQTNPELSRAATRRYKEKHRETLRLRTAQRYAERREELLAYKRTWRANNREKSRGYTRAWGAANPEAICALASRRRAVARAAGGTFTKADVKRQLLNQSNKCYWCGQALVLSVEGKYHIDHIIALAKGGTNGPENIACACPKCNQAKGTKMPWEFTDRLF